ncbi:MAG: M48 family metallopeptidase, partial [Candidatus Aminicenantes bacterium]|nr:M48 family metallopeptidase [Candidatus Aminicenantes bacterium]
VKEIKYRKMRRMWGNCRSNGVITLNSRLIKLPENVISYILFHELLHLDERGGHSIRFKRRMKKKFSDHKKIEMDLKSYFIKFDLEDIK